jgi:hypothetical protein
MSFIGKLPTDGLLQGVTNGVGLNPGMKNMDMKSVEPEKKTAP